MQFAISQHLQYHLKQRVSLTIPAPTSLDNCAIRRQMLANQSGVSGYWLSANPGYFSNKLHDADFNAAFHIRNCFPIMGSRQYCVCGSKIDCLGDHIRICRIPSLPNLVKNPAHAKLSSSLRQLLQRTQDCYQVLLNEPHVQDYFPANNSQSSRDDIDRRADIAIIFPTHATLIDVTIASPNSQAINQHTYIPGNACLRRQQHKLNYYNRHFNLSPDNENNLTIFAIETTGSLSTHAYQFLQHISSFYQSPSLAIQQILQTISITIQKIRITQTQHSRDFSLNQPPPSPYCCNSLPNPPNDPFLRSPALPANAPIMAVPILPPLQPTHRNLE